MLVTVPPLTVIVLLFVTAPTVPAVVKSPEFVTAASVAPALLSTTPFV